MIVIARRYGQLGNRLWLYAHMIAAAEEYGVTVSNPCFAEYAPLFPSTKHDLWCRYPVVASTEKIPSNSSRSLLAKSVYLAAKGMYKLGARRYPAHVLRIETDEIYDLHSEAFCNILSTHRTVFALGWQFRSELLLQKHASQIKQHFAIGPEHGSNVSECMARVRENADIAIGIHIRQGDYATFMNGRYYFSVREYASAMRQLKEQLAPKRVHFLVCGNGQLRGHDFSGLSVTFGPGHLLEDMYAFAKTDLIVGPPSTFTMWAAFYGGVPLRTLERREGEVSTEALPKNLFAEQSGYRIITERQTSATESSSARWNVGIREAINGPAIDE